MRRRSFHRFANRRRRKLLWVREAFNNEAPAATNNDDLLANFKGKLALSNNLPDFTIMRLHLHVVARGTETSNQANNGIFVSSWVDAATQTIESSAGFPYDQKYLIWDNIYVADMTFNGGNPATVIGLSHAWDVKSRRRINGITDTPFLQIQAQGLFTITDYAWTLAMLIALP